MRRRSFILFTIPALMALNGCGSSSPPDTPPTPAIQTQATSPRTPPISDAPAAPVSDVNARLDALWSQVDKGDGIAWSTATTPLFPNEWPPTPNTTWVRYAFAYGKDPQLADGNRVASPWARIEVSSGSDSATVVPLAATLEAKEVQGVQPIDPAALNALEEGEQVTASALKLTQLPAPDSPEAAALRNYYRAWQKYNGAIASIIKPNHQAFFEWVER
jgi:hypothetical protein